MFSLNPYFGSLVRQVSSCAEDELIATDPRAERDGEKDDFAMDQV